MEETNKKEVEEESIHQKLMNKAYDLWSTEEGKKLSYSDFLDVVSDKFGKLYSNAVITGNLNYQVENGGFYQWFENGYVIDLGDLIIFFEENFKENEINEKVKNLLNRVIDILDWYDGGIESLRVIDKLKYILNEVVDILDWLDEGKDCVKNLYDYKEFFIKKLEDQVQKELNQLDEKYYEINEKLNEILEEYFKTEYEKISPEIREENT